MEALSPDQQAIQAVARSFSETLRTCARDSEREGVSPLAETWAGLEFDGMDWPENVGGYGLGRLAKVVSLEALAVGDAAATLALDAVSWVCSPLLHNPSLAGLVAERVGEPGFVPAFFVDIDDRVQEVDGALSGQIPFLPARAPGWLFVLCGRRLHCLENPPATEVVPGALHAMGGSSVVLESVQPAHTMELSSEEAAALRGGWRLPLAAVLVGLSQAACAQTRGYCMERVAFGKPIAHHQAVSFLLADMEIATQSARLLVQQAARCLDTNGEADSCHSAFLQAVEAALLVTNLGVQLHGGHGYVEDHPVEKFMREARALSLLAGGVDGARQDRTHALDTRIRGSS